jgi:hypothetical protein
VEKLRKALEKRAVVSAVEKQEAADLSTPGFLG